ncbi:MAG: hypothetical protein VSS75_008375 [Candidatus Parabeggiatoa sp.]|nr:hypothetical protein [Candidatus Parabeggiatoa sp.]
MSKKTKFIIVILSVLKLWLVAAIPITAIGAAGHDDRLFLNLAHSFAQGEWLGIYNQLTLAKGPMYSIWLAFNFYMGLPLLFAQHLLYLCAGLMLVIALRKVVKHSFILIFLYALVIFSPHLELITRVGREGIYPALSVLVLAGLVGLYTNRSNKLINFGLWATFLGAVLTVFWLTREEGVWIMPSVILIIAYVVFLTYRTEQLSSVFFKKTVLCLLPLLILFGGLQLVSFINKIYYNTYTVVEVKSESFLSAYGALSRVKHPNWKRYIPVPREVRQSIYQASPAFKELEYLLEEQLKGWQNPGCRPYPETCGDIAGGWFMWVLREAVALAGYHKSGDVATHYYLRLAGEINTACDKGILDCLPERATLIPPLTQAHIRPTIEAFWQGIKSLMMGFNYRINNNLTSEGTEELLVLFRDMTRERLAPLPQPNQMTTIRGWAFSLKDEKVYFQVKSRRTDSFELEKLSRVARPDVYSHVKNQTGINYEQAKNSGFFIKSSCVEACDLLIFDNQSLLAIINLNTKERKVFSDVLMFHFDAITIENKEQFPMQNRLNKLKITILQGVAQVYQLVIPWFCSLAIIAYLVSFSIGILRRQFTFLFILNTAIVGAIMARLLIIALIEVTSFPAINFRYMSPLFPFLLIFLVLTIVDLMSLATLHRGDKKHTPKSLSRGDKDSFYERLLFT